MNRIIILGSGGAPGVPSLNRGWGKCDPNNPKNKRLRTSTYIEYKEVKFLIDTSPDLRQQLLKNDIREIDAVLYTHAHADHLHGIDDLREINRTSKRPINIYGSKDTIKYIKRGFSYLIIKPNDNNVVRKEPSLIPNVVKANKDFYISGIKITPLKLLGHQMGTLGYSFDDGEIVIISDFKRLSQSAIKQIIKKPKVMIMPLTTLDEIPYHANLKELMEYFDLIKPEKMIINHMSTSCDYDWVNKSTPENIFPAYDNMILEGI